MFKSLVQFLSRFPNLEAFYVLVSSTLHFDDNDLLHLFDLWHPHCPRLGRIVFRNILFVDNQFKERKIGYLRDGSRWVREDSRLAIDEEGDIYSMSTESASEAMTRVLLGGTQT